MANVRLFAHEHLFIEGWNGQVPDVAIIDESFATKAARHTELEIIDLLPPVRMSAEAKQDVQALLFKVKDAILSGKVVTQLLRLAQAAGVALHEGQTFARLVENGSRVAGVETETGQRFYAGQVVLALGSWTPHRLPWASRSAPAPSRPR